MGALPKQRISRHRQGNRRRHIFLKSPELVPCQTCRELHRAHHVCPNCGCEIRLIHHGDPAKMQNMQMFTCCCGTRMEKEQRGG